LVQRIAHGLFQAERQMFCNAAYKLLEHRKWVKRLGLLDDTLFSELDKFATDIDVMRDMNEHAVEYLQGKGKRPHDWIHISEGGISDASSTIDTKIGGRLDWAQLGAAAERLLATISPLGPFFPAEKTAEEEAAYWKAVLPPNTR
jgi:hypothetical protein